MKNKNTGPVGVKCAGCSNPACPDHVVGHGSTGPKSETLRDTIKATASVHGKATERVKTDGNRLRREKDLSGQFEMPFPIGDGVGRVEVTRGFKNWFSTRDAGLTVESTVTVSVACNQDVHSIMDAISQSAIVAEEKAKEGAEEMGAYLESFGKGG